MSFISRIETGNTYNIYSQPQLPAADVFQDLLLWISFLETHIYKHPLREEDYLFPSISVNGIAQPQFSITHDVIQSWLDEFTTKSGVADLVRGNFTTHCLRRGGAQYRFMYAPPSQRWTLARIRWWGGWASGEHVCFKSNSFVITC